MKLITNVLILAVAGTALAQAPANQPNKPATKPAAAGNATPSQTSAAKPTQAAPANAKPAQTSAAKPAQGAQAKPATTAVKPQATPAKPGTAAAKPQTAAAKPAVAPAKSATTAAKTSAPSKKPVKAEAKPKTAAKVVVKKTEPAKPAAEQKKKPEDILSAKNRRDPFVSVVVNREGTPCAGGGKKCIDISQVILQGVVRAPSGPIAVISSGANKTYFLRENDPVYNGVVVKIAPDSIVFRETVMDRVGKTTQREVVKKIRNVPS